MISVAIAALPEEEENLKDCIFSVKNFADEVVVLQIGKDVPNTPYVETIRNEMIKRCKGDWILILDPDERLTNSLASRLKEISEVGESDAVDIPRKNIFFGNWIRHTNWWPDRQIRFFKKGRVSWDARIHSYPKVEGNLLNLSAKEEFAIEHYGYHTISEFIERQNRYSGIEAANRLEKGEKFSWFNFFWWPIREFLVRYIKHLGFLDGFYGFALSYLMAIYKITVQIKMWEGKK